MYLEVWLNKWLNIFFPMDEQCVACESFALLDDNLLCCKCAASMIELPFELSAEETYFDRLFSCYYYYNTAKIMIHKHKTSHQRYLSHIFARMIATKLATLDFKVDGVTAIPSTKFAYFRRGCNHAEDIAKSVANLLKVPYEVSLQKTKNSTHQQKKLSRIARFDNVKGTLNCIKQYNSGACIVVIDDIITTGATLKIASEALKNKNSQTVFYGISMFYTPKSKKL